MAQPHDLPVGPEQLPIKADVEVELGPAQRIVLQAAVVKLPDFETTSTQEVVEGEVMGLSPAYNQASIETDDGRAFSLTFRTPGISLDSVAEGQRYRCLVTRRLPRVLRAERIA